MILAVLVATLVLFPFANPIYTWVARPLMRLLPQGSSMIATEVAAPFMAPFKLSMVVALFLIMPYILYEVWAFVAPGLYRHERRLVLPLVVSSTALYYLGMAFAYFLVFPLVFGFFVTTAPQGVAVMTDINKYLDFVLTLFFAFGITFEVPVATVLLVWTGVVNPDDLAGKRPYIIVAAFTIGMILTPPDVFSQTMLAVPMWLLFEAGLYASRLLLRAREARTQEQAAGLPVPTDTNLEAELDRAMAEEARVRASPDAGPRYTREGLDRELNLLAGKPEDKADGDGGNK
jgi:sec-independent protein translocase protein TatC